MPVTIKVNGTNLSLVHKFSSGISTATIPDVCKTPSPGGPVPVPYPNIAQSITLSDGTATVKGDKAMAANKGSKFAMSNGDNAGSVGGVKSNVFMKEATWILYSFDVKMDGKNAARFTDPMFHNAENAANLAGVCQNPVVVKAIGQDAADELCTHVCDARAKKDAGELPDGKLQQYVANQLSSGHPLYTPNRLGTLVEMTWEIPSRAGGPFGAVLSTTGRTLANGKLAQRMFWGALSRGRIVDTFRPDITILTNPRNACRWSNVKAFVEMKFRDDPNPDLTRNQARAKAKAGKKMVVLKESDCACS
jgi:hypothetical protein